MLYRVSVAERGLTGIANIFRSRLSGYDDLLQAGTVPLIARPGMMSFLAEIVIAYSYRVRPLTRPYPMLGSQCSATLVFHSSPTADVSALGCRYDLTDKLRTQTDTRHLEP